MEIWRDSSISKFLFSSNIYKCTHWFPVRFRNGSMYIDVVIDNIFLRMFVIFFKAWVFNFLRNGNQIKIYLREFHPT